MPAEPDTYEAFLVETRETATWVVAIVRAPDRTEARRFARLDDPARASRLADALNSRILGRRNHVARLRAALTGLPLDVRAAVRTVPVGDSDAADGLLADHLSVDPVDGLLLFPTASDGPGAITPHAACLIACAAEALSDLCHDVAQSTHRHAIGFLLPHFPARLRSLRPERLLSTAADLDRLLTDLRDGLPPSICTPRERLALDLALDHAEWSAHHNPEALAEARRLGPAEAQHGRDVALSPYRRR